MSPISSCAVIALCALLCASQPVEKLPTLRELPSEVVFREHRELVVECATESKDDGVKYSWLKDGKPIQTPQSADGNLVIKNPTVNDEGYYQCLAESPVGVASSRPVHVRHMYLETPTLEQKKHQPVEGKTYVLECHVPKAYPKPEIEWMVQGEKTKEVVDDQRFTISDEGNLYMSSVKKEDTGKKYLCIAKSPAVDSEVVLAEHDLTDVVAGGEPDHEVVQQYVTKDTTLTAGESVYLYCIYGGDPLAHPNWFKEGKDINNSAKDRVTRYNHSVGKRLSIKKVNLEDQGEYSCTVDNRVGKAQKHTFNVKVVSAPIYTHYLEEKRIVKAGEDITLPCQVLAVPEAKVSWTYNSQQLPGKLHAQTSSQGNVVNSDLTIKNIQKSDSGYYGCYAQNEYGRNYTETLVYVQ